MCGIAGIVTRNDFSLLPKVQGMCDAMSHRGPDDFGFHDETNYALGHRRLSIIDLSEAGHQPMYTEDKKCVLVYNGEIYNFKEIRKELENRGHRFHSNTDSEVVLKAYLEYGKDCTVHFRGMFAFAILDRREEEPVLFISRDHFGIKPLLYSYQDGNFAFSSELRSLMASGLVDDTINNKAVAQLMMIGYIIKPDSLYKNVTSLLPGHSMIVKKGEAPKVWKYWDLDLEKSRALSAGHSFEEQKKEVRELLIKAVEEQLVSDVPLGAFLSGGVDSTIVVGIISKILGRDIKTFSVGFPDLNDELDESKLAANTAKSFGTEHKGINVVESEIRKSFLKVPHMMDEPTLGWPQWYMVSQATARHVKVALSGLGADEFFMGYRWLSAPLGAKFNVKKKLAGAMSSLGVGNGFINSLPSGMRSGLTELMMLKDSKSEVFWRHLVMNPVQAVKYLNEKVSPESILAEFLDLYSLDESADNASKFSYVIGKGRMLSIDIRDIDAASMANSLEVRVPFLDKRLVEYVYGLPQSSKIGPISGTDLVRGKRILIEAFRDVIPEDVYLRPKRGFNLPYDVLLQDMFQPEVETLLQDSNLNKFQFLNSSMVQKCWEDYKKGRITYREIWSILSLMLFLDPQKN